MTWPRMEPRLRKACSTLKCVLHMDSIWPPFQYKYRLDIATPIIKKRWPKDHLIFIMGIPILVRSTFILNSSLFSGMHYSLYTLCPFTQWRLGLVQYKDCYPRYMYRNSYYKYKNVRPYYLYIGNPYSINTLRPRQNGHHFVDAIFKCIFLNKNVWIQIKISPKFDPKGPVNNILALVQIMACCLDGANDG